MSGQNEEPHLVFHALEGRLLHPHLWLRILENRLTISSCLHARGQNTNCAIGWHLEINGKIQVDTEMRLGCHIVCHNGRAELTVWHHNHIVARRAQARSTPIYFDHLRSDMCLHSILMDHHPIPYLKWPLYVNRQAHEQVQNHRSQCQADYDTHYTGGREDTTDILMKNS